MSRKNPKSHTENGIGIAKTLRAAASMAKLPMHIIQSAKDAGCSAFRANGTVDVTALLDFVATMPQSESATPDYHLEKALDMRANRLLKEQKFNERAKLLWPIEKIRQAWARNVIACKTKIQAADNAIATQVGMRLALPQSQVDVLREISSKLLRDALKELHAGEWGRVDCPNCKREIEQ